MNKALALFCFLLLSLRAFAQAPLSVPNRPALILISIDGMNPDYVIQADRYGLKIPNLRRLRQEGAYASGVRGVLPTVTYPTHTTMLTGVWPARHNIPLNTSFDPQRNNQGGWYWYSEDIRARTLWESAAEAGYVVGSVAWPVSVGARGVRYLIPEYWRAMSSDDDLKLLRALSSPGLLSELEPQHGKYIIDLDNAVPGDWMRTRYAASIIKNKGARILAIHIASLDHIEHDTGPGSAPAFAALEEIDRMVGTLRDTMTAAAGDTTMCVVSDHGMARVDHELNLNVAFIKAGLMTPAPEPRKTGAPAFTDWKAQPWSAGGSAAIVLKEAGDQAAEAKTGQLLKELAADPANGIAAVLDRQAVARMGGSSTAAFWVDLKPGYVIGSALTGPVSRPLSVRGTHGYAPTHPEMRASLFLAGPHIKRGLALGEVDLRSLAPTLARLLSITLPGAEAKALPVFLNE